jgi:hypothetical protein
LEEFCVLKPSARSICGAAKVKHGQMLFEGTPAEWGGTLQRHTVASPITSELVVVESRAEGALAEEALCAEALEDVSWVTAGEKESAENRACRYPVEPNVVEEQVVTSGPHHQSS